jgi:Flp pilus assembly protein TadG
LVEARSSRPFRGRSSAVLGLLRGEAGVAVVEFAVILPAFLLILLGVMDFGKVFNYWQSGTQAAAVGARAAAVDDWPGAASGTTLQEWIVNQLKTKELHDDANVCVRFPDTASAGGSNTSPGNRIEVRVQVPYGLPLVNSLFHGATLTLRSSATMRIEVDSDPPSGTANAIAAADDIGTCT